jgi:hypothetical protein
MSDKEFAVSLSEGHLTIVADLPTLLELSQAIQHLIYHTDTNNRVIIQGKAQYVTVDIKQFLPRL